MLNQREEKEVFARIDHLKKVSRNRKNIIIFQRKVMTFLVLVIVATYGFIFVNSYLENKTIAKATNIIENAKNEANNIVESSKVQANIIISNANVDATNVLLKAQQEALATSKEIINKAVNQKVDDMAALLAITEAEAGSQSVKGKAAVAAVVLNRVESGKFDDNIKDVVYNSSQFQPVANGKIYKALLTDTTVEAVEIALAGTDYSKGALYFYNPDYSSPENIEWFETLETTTVIEDHTFKR